MQPTTETSVAVTLNGTTHHIPSEGVRATIIDYTLSRMELGEVKVTCPEGGVGWRMSMGEG